MGALIYWGIVRFALVIVVFWFWHDRISNYSDWWSTFFVALVAVVIFPFQLQYRKHMEQVEETNKDSLCASCKHYAKDSMLCTALDEHVTLDYVPCGGAAWDPK